MSLLFLRMFQAVASAPPVLLHTPESVVRAGFGDYHGPRRPWQLHDHQSGTH
jgi:hypothetical protein